MALVLADRVKETTTVTGTGTATLLGAATGFQSFAVVGNANTTYYCIAGQGTAEWEVGIGTYTSSGTTLARTTILASSNAGAVVTFSAGTKDVFVTYPAGYSVNATNNPGSVGQILASNGTGIAPTWATKITQGTVVTTTSGTNIDFTAIPATTKRITVMLSGVSVSGTSRLLLQIGDSGGVEITGYVGTTIQISNGGTQTYSAGFTITAAGTPSAADTITGAIFLNNITGNVWLCSGTLINTSMSGTKTLSDVLDRVRVTTVNGTDTFDAGSINILYE